MHLHSRGRSKPRCMAATCCQVQHQHAVSMPCTWGCLHQKVQSALWQCIQLESVLSRNTVPRARFSCSLRSFTNKCPTTSTCTSAGHGGTGAVQLHPPPRLPTGTLQAPCRAPQQACPPACSWQQPASLPAHPTLGPALPALPGRPGCTETPGRRPPWGHTDRLWPDVCPGGWLQRLPPVRPHP